MPKNDWRMKAVFIALQPGPKNLHNLQHHSTETIYVFISAITGLMSINFEYLATHV